MAKILTDRELLDIVRRTVEDGEICEMQTYLHFLESLAELVTDYHGGRVGTVAYCHDLDTEGKPLGYTVAIDHSEEVPEDGGIYKDYDTDVDWSAGGKND